MIKDIVAENFPDVGKGLELHVKEANITPNYINARRPSPSHIIVKLSKVNNKEKILRAARQKNIQRNLYQVFSGFLSRNLTG